MYSRNYNSGSSGAVKAFEDAYAKEEFLRRNAASQNTSGCVQPVQKPVNTEQDKDFSEQGSAGAVISQNNDTAKRGKGLAGLFSGYDSGDMILLLLIVFFLFDSDTENDSVIPILLTVLLLF